MRLKDEWPCVAINQGKYNYPLEQSLPLSRERLTAFLKDFIQNKMKPTWRSEEAVEINDDDTVSVLVGTTVKQFVQDTRYDVLLNVFSSSNDLSRKLAPIWSTLADELEDVDIKMAVFNADLNDMPQNVLEIQYIPTIVLFKSQTNEKVLFLKKPSVNALKDFLREHSGLKHLVPANKTKKVKKTKKIQSAEQEEL